MGISVSHVFVHGFLGLPEDWDLLIDQLKLPDAYKIHLWQDKYFEPSQTIDKWADHFIGQFSNQLVTAFGYSLGGRLLFHAFMKKPELFKKLYLFSSNPFRMSDMEIEIRKKMDADWANRISNDSWESVLCAWGDLEIFKHDLAVDRYSLQEYKLQLSQAVEIWSPAKQLYAANDLTPELIGKLQLFCGSLDSKYLKIYNELGSQGYNVNVIEGAGHRLILSHSRQLGVIIKNQ